ncbi:5-methylthioadenosine/S-adenosylhomocysteine deaminase (MTA/SAH deaminase) [Candidatus Methylomirabilis lanthanidiphila]|uniref:5-methylthioadenosine/S-adenosylhomocysteine deaminase (MTA/SAH deaminase) n=1 Tax=Candidatus Methylomirabilis lanthanidiphila TaxID=2211376 RepID=A0A564ZJU3_9BACT|nr:amidohydrolase family protein [Candidatus Methylomirabilis lanthanidiphila]VUZ85443.1 5-methylthioadenosine/S-adenosylhomocysteine deaminase (MTA/SAH deaminase) [Candidatus Methylomirabilis lanthanidiphila]
MILTARLVLPISSPPIMDGGILIRDGAICAVGKTSALIRDFATEPHDDLGNAVLLPGLVNAHTHLELTGLRGRLPLGTSFTDWAVALIGLRSELDDEFFAASARLGATTLLRSGVTCVADITASGSSVAPLKAAGIRGIIYQEILGPDPEQAGARLDAAEAAIRSLQLQANESLLSIGLSPHAPYSLSEPLLVRCAELLRRQYLPATIHVAESPEEVTYIGLGLGPIATKLLPAVGRRAPSHRVCGESPVAFLDRAGLLSDRLLAVHGVQMGMSDLRLLKQRDVALAVCPRSNDHLNVGTAPLLRCLAVSLRVGLGTDSLASNETLSLWDEMRFARRLYGEPVAAQQLVTMATLGGAAALGMADTIGSLAPGKRADLTAVAIDRFDDADPYELLVNQASDDAVVLSAVDGKIVHQREGATRWHCH